MEAFDITGSYSGGNDLTEFLQANHPVIIGIMLVVILYLVWYCMMKPQAFTPEYYTVNNADGVAYYAHPVPTSMLNQNASIRNVATSSGLGVVETKSTNPNRGLPCGTTANMQDTQAYMLQHWNDKEQFAGYQYPEQFAGYQYPEQFNSAVIPAADLAMAMAGGLTSDRRP
jgi:hypothetical protein